MLAARSTRFHETTEQLVYDDLFLFLRDTSRGLSRIFPPQQATRWPSNSSLHSRRSTRICYISNATNVTNPTLALHKHFSNSNTFRLLPEPRTIDVGVTEYTSKL